MDVGKMNRLTLNDIQYESRFVVRIEQRDQTKRIAAGTMMIAICIFAEQNMIAYAIAALIIVTEIFARILSSLFPSDEDKVTVPLMVALWANNLISTIAYLLPSLVLANQPSIALFVAGLLWLCGSQVHITHTFAFLPFFHTSVAIPSFGIAATLLYLSSQTTFVGSTLWEWGAAAGLLIMFMSNSTETLNKQKDTHQALRSARLESKVRLRKLEHMTRHDGLTGLLNRHAYEEKVRTFLTEGNEFNSVVVFIIDLDGFKPINDTYSHDVGDQVLVTASARLSKLAGAYGVAARFGGDEFAMAFNSALDQKSALNLANKVAQVLSQPMIINERTLRISASVGIVLSTNSTDTVGSMIADADRAMYQAKSDRGGHGVIFDPARIKPRPSLEDRKTLRNALQSGQIRPHYQPKIDITTGRICGFEALARWEHPSRGTLLPGKFIPDIAELSLHGELLAQMAKRVLSDTDSMLKDGLDPGQVSINVPELSLATLSGRQELRDILEQFPETTSHITFEITEDVFIARAGDMIQDSIRYFRERGVRISLDDFGTGFASFQHLRQLDFDELKIDTSFVSGLGSDPTAEIIVEGFLSIAEGLGVTTIAEGVETKSQEQQLLRMGCTNVQGFLYGRAVPLAEARIRLEAQRGQTAIPTPLLPRRAG